MNFNIHERKCFLHSPYCFDCKDVGQVREKMGWSRYWFMPRRCMLQWRHNRLVNAITKLPDGSYKVWIEGLFIG